MTSCPRSSPPSSSSLCARMRCGIAGAAGCGAGWGLPARCASCRTGAMAPRERALIKARVLEDQAREAAAPAAHAGEQRDGLVQALRDAGDPRGARGGALGRQALGGHHGRRGLPGAVGAAARAREAGVEHGGAGAAVARARRAWRRCRRRCWWRARRAELRRHQRHRRHRHRHRCHQPAQARVDAVPHRAPHAAALRGGGRLLRGAEGRAHRRVRTTRSSTSPAARGTCTSTWTSSSRCTAFRRGRCSCATGG